MVSVLSSFPQKNLITSVLKNCLVGNEINSIISEIFRISQMKGGGNHKGGAANILNGHNFPKKLHGNERNRTKTEGCQSLIPLGSASAL